MLSLKGIFSRSLFPGTLGVRQERTLALSAVRRNESDHLTQHTIKSRLVQVPNDSLDNNISDRSLFFYLTTDKTAQ